MAMTKPADLLTMLDDLKTHADDIAAAAIDINPDQPAYVVATRGGLLGVLSVIRGAIDTARLYVVESAGPGPTITEEG